MTATTPPWWSPLPVDQPSYLVGPSPERLRIALDPLPPGAPAVVFIWPSTVHAFSEQIAWVLDEMERAALALFPRWLPGAGDLGDLTSASVAAARALAARHAARSAHFGPFLVDLAERSMQAQHAISQSPLTRSFSAEVRAAGLARAVADAYNCARIALLIEVPDGLNGAQQRALAAAAGWICQHGNLAAWFTGGPLDVVESIAAVPITLPGQDAWLATPPEPRAATPPTGYAVFPAIAGQPRSDSPAEQALERVLKRRQWAVGRRWNHTVHLYALSRPYRLDLVWEHDRLVVEVDGDDHRGKAKYADDRVRDVQLALLGYRVARFTNEHVLADVEAVVAKIEQLLCNQRGTGTDVGRHNHVQD